VRNGKRALLRLLLTVDGSIRPAAMKKLAMVEDLLASPVLERVLCNPRDLAFKPTSRIVARIAAAEA
jgi:hypothetical protein